VTEFLNGRVTLHEGDCLDVLRTMPGASVDSVVTDPPYELGFMGKHWDHGSHAHTVELWSEVLRVLKPGGHLLAFGGTRTYHRLACAIEDAGFEIRDQIAWVYGSGFPKSHNISKAIDKAAGAEREIVGRSPWDSRKPNGSASYSSVGLNAEAGGGDITAPATEAARQWEGWGSALKPALEPICVARKPFIGTLAENVLAYGTGGLNVDGCRVHADDAQGGTYTVKRLKPGATLNKTGGNWRPEDGIEYQDEMKVGRWPANLVHDGSEEVLAGFPDLGKSTGGRDSRPSGFGEFGGGSRKIEKQDPGFGDSGSAARFFYTAKADSDDRLGSKHPTVKPVDLMQWLVRLVTSKDGLVLDPFAGTGTTGEAAFREGMRAVLIEREPEYQADIARRMALVLGGPDERRRETIKAKGLTADAGPLFGGDLFS
jgi:site-specific DNA-methyltransferase (adenine-specific)